MVNLGDLIGSGTSGFLSTLLIYLIVLMVIVFVHEFGHFWVGRRLGVGVTVFSVGFGRELVGWTDQHGTRWKICLIPLGGYVKFVGDLNAASVPDPEQVECLSPSERLKSFPHQSVGRRAAIVAAGPMANFLFAILLFAGIGYFSGRDVLEPRVETVRPGSVAERAGFLPNDLVVSINGRAIDSFAEMQRLVRVSPGETLAFGIDRAGSPVTLQAIPELSEETTPFGNQKIGLLGITAPRDPSLVRKVPYSALGALKFGFKQTYDIIEITIKSVGSLLIGKGSLDQIAGPVGVAQAAGQVASLGGLPGLTWFVGVLSVSIGLLNLFPIPLLDGGHLLYYAAEAVRGRPLSPRIQDIGFRIGLAIVVMLMIFATSNDFFHRILPFLLRGT